MALRSLRPLPCLFSRHSAVLSAHAVSTALPQRGCLVFMHRTRDAVSCVAGSHHRRFAGGATLTPSAKADQLIEEHVCVIFSKSTCPFCAMAKDIVLGVHKAKCHVLDMDTTLPFHEMDAMQEHLRVVTGARSVPRVFVGGKCIGGGDDVAELHARGELKKLLEEAGAL